MEELKAEFSSYPYTLNELLIHLGDRSLPTTPKLPETTGNIAKYSDAILAEYHVELAKIGYILPANYPKSDMPDLVITRPKYKTDMRLLHDYCLVSVNGYFHRTESSATDAYVYDGATTMRDCRLNHLGILSFLDIGKITEIKISKDDIYVQDTDARLKDKVNFSVNADLTGKSFFLVLGGYLVFPETDVFYQTGDNLLSLNLSAIPYTDRLLESIRNLDLSSLDIMTEIADKDILDMDKVWSDETIKQYLTLSQSFLVVVDTPRLEVNKIHIRQSKVPGMYISYKNPCLPLIVGYGKAVEYWKVEEAGHWSVTIQDSFYRDYSISKQPIRTTVANNFLVPNSPILNSRAFLLEITGYNS